MKNKSQQQVVYPQAVLVENPDAYAESADFSIMAVSIEGNVMSISVEYSGGCEKHSWELVGSESIQKSLPPKRGVRLIHQNNGDSCRSIVEENLKFDISVLAYEGGEIILNLQGWANALSYTKAN
ncbi:MAG: hypothetical protein IPM74_05800 [Crocinitomicaceae bacterium]|nr:hypothetical protein [Crocinitomicaceae bacterium]MBK8925417.1 hypothetical protein [Crocinitomicaceae bacterium]